MEWWSPESGSSPAENDTSSKWIKAFGIPLHGWTEDSFRYIGNSCGGFIDIDVDTRQRTHQHWARICVQSRAEDLPRTLNLKLKNLTYKISILEDRVVQIVGDDSEEVTVEWLKEVKLGLKSISTMTSSGQQTKAPVNRKVQNFWHSQPSHFISNSDKSSFLHRQPSHFISNSDKGSKKGGWDPPITMCHNKQKL